METKQTAIEWLVRQIAGVSSEYIIDGQLVEVKEKTDNLLFNLDIDITTLVNQAKAMEELQIQLAKQESYNDGWLEATQYIMKYDKKQEDGNTNETYANDTTKGLPKEDSKRRAWHR